MHVLSIAASAVMLTAASIPAPIASILTPLYDSIAENPHLPHASSLCGACQAACPVKINIPHMLIGLRELQHKHKGLKSRWERWAYAASCAVLRRPWLYR